MMTEETHQSAGEATPPPRAQTEPKKPRRGKITRDKIIAVAEKLIAEHGPDGFQLQNVTEQLGITPPAIYNHFKDREDLVAEVAEKGGRILDERMRRQTGEDILSSLRRNAREYVAFLSENPAHARIILWDMARQGTSGWKGLALSNMRIRERMRVAFEKAIEQGEIRPIRIETYLQLIYIGAASAITWTEYSDETLDSEAAGSGAASSETSPAVPPSPPRTSPTDPTEVARIQDEVEEIVLRILSPDRPS